MNCRNCVHLVPHSSHGFVGYCPERGTLIFGGEQANCDNYEPIDERRIRAAIDSHGWIYCADCRRAIFEYEEALEHARRGELLVNEFMRDEVAPEEVPSAD